MVNLLFKIVPKATDIQTTNPTHLRKRSFLSLRSLKLSPTLSRKDSTVPDQTLSPSKSYCSSSRLSLHNKGETRRKSFLNFLRKSSIFSKHQDKEDDQQELPGIGRSYLGQIYRDAKMKFSKSKASFSDEVSYACCGSFRLFHFWIFCIQCSSFHSRT